MGSAACGSAAQEAVEMRSTVALLVLLLIVAGSAAWWLKFEHAPPRAEIFLPERMGRSLGGSVVVTTPGWPGLRRVRVLLESGGKSFEVARREYPAESWLGSRVGRDTIVLNQVEIASDALIEGPAEARAVVETYEWKLLSKRWTMAGRTEITVDLTPPDIELLTTQHNIRLGGSSVVLFRVSPDTESARVRVADYDFPATLGYFSEPTIAVSIFAVPEDLGTEAQPYIEAEDGVGNARRIDVPVLIRHRDFPERRLNISDSFLQRKIPTLLRDNDLPPHDDLVKGYLKVNRDLRRDTEVRLREVTAKSVPHPLWDGAFRRQSNAATMSSFADRRVYLHDGEEIDRQTHLGYDLASTRGATIEATQNGRVVLAGDLGIYGRTVVLDHGLGVFSLYGHLRSIQVHRDQRVEAGQGIGQSGETGLAGGDHLHFSIMLYGIHVDPVEWWDSRWLRDHVTAKLSLFPAAPARATNEAAEARSQGAGRGEQVGAS